MSGFVRKSLRLVFDDPELEGLEVKARRLNIGQMLDLMELRGLASAGDASEEVRLGMKRVFGVLAGALLSWNLEEPAGVPVPLNADTLAELDMGFVMAIIDALRDATTAVPVPLGPRSSAGVPSEELSIPMAPLSESPTN